MTPLSCVLLMFGLVLLVAGLGLQLFGFFSLSLINENKFTRAIPDEFSWGLIGFGFALTLCSSASCRVACSKRRAGFVCMTLLILVAVVACLASSAVFIVLEGSVAIHAAAANATCTARASHSS